MTKPDFCCIHSLNVALAKAWADRVIVCACDPHVQFCDVCFPPEFRPGGYWDTQKKLIKEKQP